MITITLTRDQRDGLVDWLAGELGSDELPRIGRDRDAGAFKRLLARHHLCVELLDQLGWEEAGDRDEYELVLSPESRHLLVGLTDRIRQTLVDDGDHPHFLRIDGAALAAVELAAVA